MKKLVIKTTLITLASLIGAMAIAFGAVALFAPGFTAGIFDGVGNYSASVFFYEKQYGKTGSVSDLVVLVDNIDYEKDGARAEKYLSQLLSHEDFDEFCSQNTGAFSNEEYYNGNYALVLASNGKFTDALTVANDYVVDCGYTKYNPYRVLAFDFSGVTDDQLSQILSDITVLSTSGEITDLTQIGYVYEDINNITDQLKG